MNTPLAIVVVAYNRPQALKGLLDSLLAAQYPPADVPLVIAIDGGGDPAVLSMAEAFAWPHGTKTIKKQPAQLGLKQHILACGRLTKEYGNIVLLEDDLEVAQGFYKFAIDALTAYGTEDTVAGISLYGYTVAESTYEPFEPDTAGHDAYLMQFPASWGQAWTAGQWQGFEAWLGNNPDPDFSPCPTYIQSWGKHSWKKLFAQYLIATNKYFVFPTVSFSSNKGYAGTHFARRLTLFDVPLYAGPPLSLAPVEALQRYNIHFNPVGSTKGPSGQQLQSVEVAEYKLRVDKGWIRHSNLNRALFLARYKFHNYLNAIKRLIG